MLQMELTLTDGETIALKFIEDNVGDRMGVINQEDILEGMRMEATLLDEDIFYRVKHVYFRQKYLLGCVLSIGFLLNVEHVEFERGFKGMEGIRLPSYHAYEVVNVPTDINHLLCSPYANITNLNELLEKGDLYLEMKDPLIESG